MVKRTGVQRAGVWGNWGDAPQGEAECHITRERSARAPFSSACRRARLERPAHGTSIAPCGDSNLIVGKERPP
jgi:hypothetical protein